jgi:hypothetical protein
MIPRLPETVPGELVRAHDDDAVLERLRTMPYRQLIRWAGSDESRLRLATHARGYRRGWVWHRMQEARL